MNDYLEGFEDGRTNGRIEAGLAVFIVCAIIFGIAICLIAR